WVSTGNHQIGDTGVIARSAATKRSRAASCAAAGLLRGACHRGGPRGPDPLPRNDGARCLAFCRWRPPSITITLVGAGLRGASGDIFPGALSILKGAVPDRARGLGHMAPTYFRREPGIDAPTACAAPHFFLSRARRNTQWCAADPGPQKY